MNIIERDIYVLADRTPVSIPIDYVQGTNLIPIKFNIVDYDLPAEATAKVYVKKPSTKAEFDTATIDGNSVIIDVKDTMFSEKGTHFIQVLISKDDKTLVTFEYPVRVGRNNVAGELPESENRSNFLDDYLNRINQRIDDTEERLGQSLEEVVAAKNTAIENANITTNNAEETEADRQETEQNAAVAKSYAEQARKLVESVPSWAKQPAPDNTLTQSGQAADAKAVGDMLKKLSVKRYGMKINKNDSNPATRCTYLFDAVGMTPAAMNYTTGAFDFGDWGDVFFVKNNYPAMVRYDGTEDYKLDPNDHTKKTDGTESDVSNVEYGGNAMSVFGCKIWLSQYEDDNYEYMIVSNIKYNESYNDDAYVREDGSHADKLYYPMFGGSYDGTRLRSLAGQTLMYSTNASTEIARAKANGDGWNIGSWSKRNLLNCMLKIMAKTDNSKAAYGQGQTTGWVNDASQNYGHLPTGTLTDKGQFFGYNGTAHEVKVFFIEKWWGNRWDRINGLLMVGGEILAKMTPPYNLTGADFEKVGITFTGSGGGYQKATKSSKYGRLPVSVGGSSSKYTCDHFWWNAGITAVALVGGCCGDSERCGAYCLYLYVSASSAWGNVGASVFLE